MVLYQLRAGLFVGLVVVLESVRLGVKKKVGGTYIKVTEMLRDSSKSYHLYVWKEGGEHVHL